MEFKILGPLHVASEGLPVPLPGRTLPRLLAVLLLEAGHVVPLPHLIDALWGDDPPATARRQVQNTIATARGLFTHGEAELETVGDGYRLRVRPEHLDSLRFQRAVRIAREQVAVSEPEAALASLREALELWRGPALAGFTGRGIESGARRWDEERAAAEEARAELELELATGVSVVPDLRRVLERHPYRQHAAELLMTALYRQERSAEALDVYESIRRQLAGELGIDPGTRLREVHTAILREDSALAEPKQRPLDAPRVVDRAGTRGSHEVATRLTQLPAVDAPFSGRGEEIAALDAMVASADPGASIAVVSGIGGSGKTTLALHWAHRMREQFPDGQLYVNLRGFDRAAPLTPLDAFAEFLRALGVPAEAIPSDVDKAASLLRSRLAGTRTLVILDNARDSQQVLPLMPATAGCIAVVTSRSRLPDLAAVREVVWIEAGPLDAEDAVQFLESLIGPERITEEPEHALRIAQLCGGLPLALRIVGAGLAAQPEATLADIADGLSNGMLEQATERNTTPTVAAVFDQSFERLEDDERLLCLSLALLPGVDFSGDLALAVARRDPAETGRTLSTLSSAHFIEEHQRGRFRFHNLMRQYLRGKARDFFDDAVLKQLRQRVIDWFARGDFQAVEEHWNLIATYSEWNGLPGVSRLLTILNMLVERGLRDASSEMHAALPDLGYVVEIGIKEGQASIDPMDAVRAYALADAVAYASGDLHQSLAYAQKTLEHLARTPYGDRTGKARNDLASTLTLLGRYREATALLREALHAAEVSGNDHVLVEVLTSLGTVLRRMGQFVEAEELLRRARAVDDASPGGPAAAGPLLALVELHVDQGRISAAEDLCRDIAEMLREHPSKPYRARLYVRRAEVHRADADFARAEAALVHGLELLEELNSRRDQLVHTYALAELYVDHGEVNRAREVLDRVAPYDQYQTSETLAVKARVLCKLLTASGDLRRAIKMGHQACDVFAAMPDPLQQTRSLLALADVYRQSGETVPAATSQSEADDLLLTLGLDHQRHTTRYQHLSDPFGIPTARRSLVTHAPARAGHLRNAKPITVYTSETAAGAPLAEALIDFLNASEATTWPEPPVIGSFKQVIQTLFPFLTKRKEAEALLAEGIQAAKDRTLEKYRTQLSIEQADAIQRASAALNLTPYAVIELNTLLIIKTPDMLVTRAMTEQDSEFLRANQDLLAKPDLLLDMLQRLPTLTEVPLEPARALAAPVDRPALGQIAKAAHRRAERLERALLDRWPSAWADLDLLHTATKGARPEWCLLPVGATTTVPGAPVEVLGALYAHRYSGAVWVIESDLADRLLRTTPDRVNLEALAGLPEWCVYLAAGHPEFPSAGVWMHLEQETDSGRPNLRLLIDGDGDGDMESLLPLRVYLDCTSAAEALADMHASAQARLHGQGRDGVNDDAHPDRADDLVANIEGFLAIAAYLAQPEADITGLEDPQAKPSRLNGPTCDRRTWLVGYSTWGLPLWG